MFFQIFAYLTEAIIVYMYISHIYEPKKNKLISFITILVSYLILFFIYKALINIEFVNTIIITLTNIVLIYFCFKSSFKSSIFHGVILCILQIISEFLTAYITSLIYSISFQYSIDNHFEIGVGLSRILYFLFTNFLSKISVKETNVKTWGKWFALSLLPLSSIYVIIVMKIITDSIALKSYQNILIIISISFLLVINIIIYFVYEQAEKNNQKLLELELTNQKNDIDMQYLNLIEKKNETMNVMAHDYKNHMICLQATLEKRQLDEALDYVKSITKQEIIDANKFSSGNQIADSILSEKSESAANIGTQIQFSGFISDEIPAVDLCTMLSNALDNAIEACEKLSLTDSAVITVKCAVVQNVQVIKLSNPNPDNKNSTETSKLDKDNHGFGLYNIRRTVEKLGGEMRIPKQFPEFVLELEFPIK